MITLLAMKKTFINVKNKNDKIDSSLHKQ